MKRPNQNQSEIDGKKIHLERNSGNDEEGSNSDTDELDNSVIDDGEFGPTTGLGSIKSIEMTNFMCHSYLQMDLLENINFITGRNGSGKSAILTALTVALGGRASFTNRASSVSKLLKEGTE